MQFTAALTLKVPPELAEAVKVAAAEHFLAPSSYIRRALAEQLKRDGIQPRPSGHSDKGYDTNTAGEARHA